MIKIHPYRTDELDTVVSLWYRSWTRALHHIQHPRPFTEWRTRFREEIASAFAVWVAGVDDAIAGFMAIDAGRGYIDQIFVDPDLPRMGVGVALMTKAKALAPSGLALYTLRENVAARAFHERHGFVAGPEGINRVNGRPNVEYRWLPESRR